MKKSILLLLSTITLVLVSCKKESSEKEDIVQEEVVDNAFNVVLDVIIKQDDDVALYYTTDGSVDFSKIEPIWQGVKGSPLAQQIKYKLPEGVKPTQFRFDFGMNPKQEDIYFTKVTFSYLGKEKVVACPEMVDFFRANDNYCTFNTETGLIQAKPNVDGKRVFPSIYPHEKNLQPELEKLF
jgi:hypothetical protein